jgi:hypothetical protein
VSDDLRFGDVDGSGDAGGDRGEGIDPEPLAVAAIVVGIIVVSQPLSADIAGLSMNVVGAIVVAIGGILGALQ